MNIRIVATVFLLGLFLTWNPLPANAITSLTVSAQSTGTDGDIISAQALFSFVTHDFGSGDVNALQIVLTNTSNETGSLTKFRGNLLTGIFFSIDGAGTLDTASTGFDGLAATVFTATDGTSVSNVDIAPAVASKPNNLSPTDGTYQLSNGPFGTANSGNSYSAYDYGIATVGMGLTGFNGNAVGGDNYGIAAAGSDLTEDGLPSALPVIDTSAIFWIRWTNPNIGLSEIDQVAFTFGSLPDNVAVAVVPEPATVLLLGTGVLGLAFLGWRRRQD